MSAVAPGDTGRQLPEKTTPAPLESAGHSPALGPHLELRRGLQTSRSRRFVFVQQPPGRLHFRQSDGRPLRDADYVTSVAFSLSGPGFSCGSPEVVAAVSGSFRLWYRWQFPVSPFHRVASAERGRSLRAANRWCCREREVLSCPVITRASQRKARVRA